MHVTMKIRQNSVNKAVLAAMVSLLCCSQVSSGGRIARTMIPFKGTASGGTLVIGGAEDPHYAHLVSITTSPGESAESVVSRLARAIAYSNSIFNYNRAAWEVDRDGVAANMALGSTLRIMGFPGGWLLAGTETGLGIPKPPLFLSCSYDKDANKLEVKWINPPGEYDSIKINWRYGDSDKGGGDFLPFTPTSYIIGKPIDANDLDIRLMGFRHEIPPDVMVANSIPLGTNATPSNLTAIHLTGNGYCQEETYGIPFTVGIAPNWAAWSTAAKVDKAAFEQEDKYDANFPVYGPVRALLTKPFYQVINAPPQGVVHGVYRRFLGLTPGHTYRIAACLSTLDVDSIKGDWSLSLCAAYNGPDGKNLTAKQLAGLDALPDGKIGPQAGQIASYSPDITTKGNFDLVFSGENAPGGLKSSHITLPTGVDTITVWIRFTCSDPNGKVGFSGLRLEDITASGSLKSPEQIRLEEHQEEARFLMGVERMLHGSSP